MNAKELQAELAKHLGVSQSTIAPQLKVYAEEIVKQLAQGNAISLMGLGVLETRKREARESINPITKEKMAIPEKNVPAFRVSGSFKEKLKQQPRV